MTGKTPSSPAIMFLAIIVAIVLSVVMVWLTFLTKDGSPTTSASEDAEARIAPVARIQLAAPEPENTGPKDAATIYKTVCHVCHETGLSGSPKAGNKEDWAPRIAQGIEVLDNSALHGKNAMPPKGGATKLSDDEIKATVQYMVDMVK